MKKTACAWLEQIKGKCSCIMGGPGSVRAVSTGFHGDMGVVGQKPSHLLGLPVGPDLRAGRAFGWLVSGRPEVGPYHAGAKEIGRGSSGNSMTGTRHSRGRDGARPSRYGCTILAAAVLAALAVSRAAASVIEETLVLSNGWNAVYLESTPLESDASAFFGGLPVAKATCYRSGAYSRTAQLSSDGSEIAQQPVSHLVWDASAPDASTLGQVLGGQCYFIFATNAAQKTFQGTPCLPRTSWQVSDGDEGFATFAPVSVPAGTQVSSAA